MQGKVRRTATDYLARNHRRRTWKSVVSVLASIVVFCTTYAMILPALTLEDHTAYCGFEEHQHSQECYEKSEQDGAEDVLTCVKEEHVHDLSCYSDPDADVESPEDWSRSVSCVRLTGSRHRDLVAVAESQLGYTESGRNYAVDDDGITKRGYTRYGAWYGDPYGDWCPTFVSFCLEYAEIPAEIFPREASCSRWVETLKKEEYGLYREKADYEPEAGDLVFLDMDGDSIADRVGLAAELLEATENEPSKLRVIEGNSDQCVQYTEYPKDDESILGYGQLPEEPRVEYIWSQDGMEVVVSVRESADLPENASLTVTQLSPEDEESVYGERYAASQEKIAAEDSAEITQFDLFRIALKADGQEILSQEEARVEIRLPEDEPSALPGRELLRYSEDGIERVVPKWDEASGCLIGSFNAALSGEYAVADVQRLQVLAEDLPLVGAGRAQEEVTLTPHKTIDAFRDGEPNPDTDLEEQDIDQTDLYRLYLDAELSAVNNPIDLLIIVDQSGSMHNDYNPAPTPLDPDKNKDMTKEGGAKAYRDEALRLILNGTSSTDRQVYEANKQNGLIYRFLKANPENKVCVVGFQGNGNGDKYRIDNENAHYKIDANGNLADVTGGWLDEKGTSTSLNNHNGDTYMNVYSGIADAGDYLEAATLFNWTGDPTFVDVRGIYGNATNYTAAFLQAQRALDDPAADDGHQKVILFLSDGLPTCYVAYGGREASFIPWRPAIPEHYYRGGTGSDETDGTGDATDTAFTQFITDNPDVIFHAVGICGNSTIETRLENMAKQGHGDSYAASETDDLKRNLKKLMFGAVYTKLTIEDQLSEYVDLYESQPDFKVTRKESDGTTVTTLYENGTITDAGKGVITSVNYDPGTKKVTVLFDPIYTAEVGTTVTLSFNVKTNRTAYEKYAKNGYQGVKGDTDTDYGENATSSNLPGFRSNGLAQLKYEKQKVGEKEWSPGSLPYPDPVVQAAACKVVLQKTDDKDFTKMLEGAEFTLYRKAFEGETGEPLEGLFGSYVKMAEKLTTDADGQITVDSLIPGDYCFVETEAPTSYKPLEAPVPFTLSHSTDGSWQIVGSDLTITVGGEDLPALRVTNTSWGHELPQTGGAGSIPYITGGILLMTTASILLYKKKKRRKEDFASS